MKLIRRPRRLRELSLAKAMIRECSLHKKDFILPVFVSDHCETKEPIESMPEVYRWSEDAIVAQVAHWKAIGLNAFALFPCVMPEKKCSTGKEAINPNSISFQAAKKIKARHKDSLLIADIALDPFTDHGHDGILDSSGKVDNDLTVEILCKSAVIAAQSGFDVVAPSDMMDGRIGEIRKSLDEAGFEHIAILAYSAKFCSAYYGPFRDAISSSQKEPIDKSGYQLDPANHREALLELKLDEQEGADILMVKPAEPYLDIIKSAKENSSLPVAAYQVSGEYSRIWAASKLGWLDLDKCAEESLISIKRAGADMILTYFAERIVARI
ncbi:MAG: porphobilinogen synthase [Verrucomicrobiota bacterium]|nr:porphobilinogen synthase [Verrucomicrobiota bacterium]